MGLYKRDDEVRDYVPLMTITFSSIFSKNRRYDKKIITYI
jgi:hypothetical protein